MKFFSSFILLVLLFTYTCFSQDYAPIINIALIPDEGILLDRGWKFQAGDNSDFANPEYDDKAWEPINPTMDIHDLPQIPKSGIVWFRLHLSIDTALRGKQLALSIQQSGASEIYLNGRLIHQFGVVSSDPNKVKAFNPLEKPVSLTLDKEVKQVFAVRYALQPGILYGTHWRTENLGLNIIVDTTEKANDKYQQIHGPRNELNFFKVGVFLILSILFLTYYLFYPAQKVNLYFSLYSFLQAVTWAAFRYYDGISKVELYSILNNVLLVITVVSLLIMLIALYRLLDQKKDWVFYSLVVLGIISVPCGAFIYGWGWIIFARVFTNLINLNITWIAFQSIRNHRKGAWIIATGGIGFLVFWLLFTSSAQFFHIANLALFTLAHLCIPVAVAIYMGYDFALTNRSLQQKLTEVKNLSAEKQQILASQNEILEKQVTQRTTELAHSLKELKETQVQLIQQEKMASLGELTAGIAHEIQNPLNFINNFSELNKELVTEMNEEIENGNFGEVKTIAKDITNNEEKINYHGKRADAIVKNMLQHSRSNSGVKEPTDINALTSEYLRLCYHGFRAKDKSFSATLSTYYDETIEKINIIPQDIGRVILNLINNALYAIAEKKKQLGDNYEPIVTINTKKFNDKVSISVKDNGNGIPQKDLDKIFQPFFTTKPTGHGTGLGLSLSYDIIKAHGGELKAETKECESAEFIVSLPLNAR